MTTGVSHLSELKLRPPVSRDGLVRRARILGQLEEASRAPVITIIAPPGYGKTTVLTQLQGELDRPSAWLTLDESQSDPVVLLEAITEALAAAGLVDDRLRPESLVTGDALTSGVSSLGRALDQSSGGALLLDQVDHLTSRAALDVIGGVMSRLTDRLQIVAAARTGDGLPLAALRSRGQLFELGTSDLAMDVDEASRVFEAAGVPPNSQIDDVLKRTEGWPAGIYLTAMAMKAGSPGPEVHGDDVYLADYLREELLSPVADDTMDFLLRSSILTTLSGSLCDHVLSRQGSARTLIGLEQANLLIVPMDRTRTWYRYHSLLRDYLRSELERTHPTKVAGLHSRAGTWLEAHGFPELAGDHFISAGDSDRFAGLVKKSARRIYSLGRVETVLSWISALEDGKELVTHPELAAVGAFVRALEGDAGGAERMAMHVFNDADGSRREDDELGPFGLMLRSYQAERGVDQALADARAARAIFHTTEMEWLHSAMGAEALATQAAEGIDAAEPIWTDALWRSEGLAASPFTSAALAQRALIAITRDDWLIAESYISQSLDVIQRAGLERYITSALTYTLAGRIATRAGEVEEARSHLASAALVRPRLTVAMPYLAVQNLHELARAFIEVADVAGARRVLRDAADIIALRPKLGTFVTDHAELKGTLATLPAGSVGASSLTNAELRLLPLLVTHLSYPEIGERLYVSRHTVKTQAMSIYRKLGVSSRTEAVARAREVGLLSL